MSSPAILFYFYSGLIIKHDGRGERLVIIIVFIIIAGTSSWLGEAGQSSCLCLHSSVSVRPPPRHRPAESANTQSVRIMWKRWAVLSESAGIPKSIKPPRMYGALIHFILSVSHVLITFPIRSGHDWKSERMWLEANLRKIQEISLN